MGEVVSLSTCMNEMRVRGTHTIYQDSGRRSSFGFINFKSYVRKLFYIFIYFFYDIILSTNIEINNNAIKF